MDGGNYACLARNQFGAASTTGRLLVTGMDYCNSITLWASSLLFLQMEVILDCCSTVGMLCGKWWFPFMGTRTASPRGRYGERPQRDSVWRYIWKNTTCWPATAHDVTTGVPQYKCRREDTSSAFSSSLTGLFEACRVNLVRVQFSNSTMASTSKAFRKCVDPCPRYLTPDDTHDCCVFCLGMEHARDVLEGAVCVHCERLSVRKLSSRLSLFSRKEGQPSASRDSRPTVAEARRRMKSWGSQLVVADKLERDRPLFARVGREREWAAGLWWCDLSDIIRCSS